MEITERPLSSVDDSKLTYTVYRSIGSYYAMGNMANRPISNPEDDLMELLRRKCEIEEMIDYCKDCIREDQQRLKDAFEKGGIQPNEEFPEHVDANKLIYLKVHEDAGIPPKSEFDVYPEFK